MGDVWGVMDRGCVNQSSRCAGPGTSTQPRPCGRLAWPYLQGVVHERSLVVWSAVPEQACRRVMAAGHHVRLPTPPAWHPMNMHTGKSRTSVLSSTPLCLTPPGDHACTLLLDSPPLLAHGLTHD